jgi:1-deoxy-D-xylulose-5-phosphate reductoisomerase
VITIPQRKRIVLLGATGSIGENTLRVIATHQDKLELVAIAAKSNVKRLAEIARTYHVKHVGIFDETAANEAKALGLFESSAQIVTGLSGLVELVKLPEADCVVVAVVGTTGLEPALATLSAGKQLALASKEILVLAGKFVMEAARKYKSQILPIDSEHNAVFQCLEGNDTKAINRVFLTASGGAFRDLTLDQLHSVKPEDALKHPNWAMGPKITVDSATLANKGLELIEAQCLFNLKAEQCDAIIHPQSIIHCIVGFNDGSMLAQLCPPSMTFPIQHSLLYPNRAASVLAPLDLSKFISLELRPVDLARFPMLRLARHAMTTGGISAAVYNAANEIAVEAFLAHKIPFLSIPKVVEKTLSSIHNFEPTTLVSVIEADSEARRIAMLQLAKL